MGGHDHSLRSTRRSRLTRTSVLLATLALTVTDAVVLAPAAHADSPPVARDDVARTDSGAGVNVYVTTNDFDPDGDSFGVAEIAIPAHGTVGNGGNSIFYTPDPGFSGIETISYTVQDSTGASSIGTARVWVDTGAAGSESPVADEDYSVVYQDGVVGFTTADLLANDDDPQGQTLTIAAVSEPSNDG